jgi:nitroreductase
MNQPATQTSPGSRPASDDLAAAFRAIVANRRSVRAFRPDPVPEDTIREIFELAQWSPSNCNTQPWTVMLASGETRDRLRDAYLSHIDAGKGQQGDMPYVRNLYPPHFTERQVAHIACQHKALGIVREDKASRMGLLREQLSFFGAPHVALLFMPEWGNEREASDLGMFAQSVLLGLSAYGLAGLPQTLLGLYAEPVRQVLPVDPSLKLLFGSSFGYEDVGQPGVRLEQDRAPLGEAVQFFR